MRVTRGAAAFAFVALLLTTVQAQGQQAKDRLKGPISEGDRISLEGNVHPMAAQAQGRSLTTPIPMDRMVLVLKGDPAQNAELEQLIAQQNDPKSPNFHNFLTPEEFGQRFGVSDNDLAKLTSWLTSHGFTIDEIPAGRRSIVFSGMSDQVAATFNTEIRRYMVGREAHIANASDPQIPASLAPAVNGILKLHNFQHHGFSVQAQKLGPAFSMPQYSTGGAHYLAPADFATIYNLNPLYSSSVDGTGQSIAIVARSNVNLSDIASFRSQFGLPANPPKITIVNTDPGLDQDEIEAVLDTEWSGAVAPKATVNLVVAASTNTADGTDLSAQYIVNHNVAPVMSMSYGECEAYMGSSQMSFYNSLWQQAAAQGISVFVSAGDSGAAGCEWGGSSSGSVKAINGLCSSPYSVCVGGTQFSDTTNPGQYWLSGNNAQMGSAQGYIPEAVWNESGANGGSGLWAGGGGSSIVYAKPAWQVGTGVPNDSHRDVPDVSLAAAGHDGYLIVADGYLESVGGTSASSPSFAGLMALINQKTASHQGNPDANFYALATQQRSGGAAIFHDITAGNNSVPNVAGFSAASGYDLATGLGSVDGNQLVTHWTDLTHPTPSMEVAPAQTSPAVTPGQTSTVAINVLTAGGFNAAVTLSVSGAVSGLTATLSSSNLAAPGNGSVTLTLTAAQSLTFGTYPITVTATGGNLTSTVTLNVAVTAGGTFTLATTTNYYNVGQGNSGIMTFSITPSGGFSAPMTVTIPGLPAGMTASTPAVSVSGTAAVNIPLTIAAAKTTPTGVYQLLVTVTGGGTTKTFPLQITVTAPSGCTLASNPASISMTAGNALNVQLSCGNVQGNFNSALTLTITKNVPDGVVIQQLNAQISPTVPGTLAITSANTAAPGNYSIQVNAAVPDGFNQTITIPFVITAPNTLLMTSSASSVTVQGGQTATVQVTTRHSGAFASAVSLVAAGLPAGVTASISPASFSSPGDGTATITLTAAPTAAANANAYFVVAALGGNQSAGVPIGLVVLTAPGFALTATQTATSLVQGGTAALANVAIGSFTGGFNSAVTLSASGLPSGLTASFSKTSLSGTGSAATLTLTSSKTVTPGTYSFTLTGTSGSLSKSLTLAVTVTAAPNFTLTAGTPTGSLWQGSGSATVNLTLGGFVGGFNSPVALTIPSLPTGLTASFSKSSLTGSGATSVLTITAAKTMAVGTYPIVISGAGAGITESASANVTVATAPGFTLSASAPAGSLVQGSGSASVTVTLGGLVGGFSSAVTLTAPSLPSGLSASFSKTSLTGSGATSVLTITAAKTMAVGTYPITISGTGAGVTASATANFTVAAAPGFTLAASAPAGSLVQGSGSASVTVTLGGLVGGFNSAVTLTAPSLPSGLSASFSKTSLTGSGATSVLTITAAKTATAGVYPITISGTGAGVTASTTATLTVTVAPGFNLTATAPTGSLVQGSGSASVNLTLSGFVGGFNSPVTLAAANLPSGMTASFSKSTLTGSGATATLTLTSARTVSAGTYSITVTGTGGGITQSVSATITVNPAPNFVLTAGTSSTAFTTGNSTSVNLTVAGLVGGFNAPVTLSASGLPTGMSAAFSKSTLATSGATSTLTLTTSSAVGAGTYHVTVTGTGGGIANAISITVSVAAAAAHK